MFNSCADKKLKLRRKKKLMFDNAFFHNDKLIYNITMTTFTTSRCKQDKYNQIEQDTYRYGNEITNLHCKICRYT